ncbi:unnamed protein product [Diamesa hyperborea]
MDFIANNLKRSNYRANVEMTFYESFKWFLCMNQVFCVAPINISFFVKDKIHKMRPKRDLIVFILHLIWSLFILTCVIVATRYQHQDADETMGFMTRILYVGEYIIGTFNLILIITGCQYQKKNYVIIFKRLVNVDINLQKCGIDLNYSKTRIYLQRSMICYTIFFMCVICVDFLYNQMSAAGFFRSSTVYTMPNIVSLLALTQYSAALHYIRDKFIIINAMLRRLIRDNNLKGHFKSNNKLNIISVLSLETNKNMGIDRILNLLRKQHAELCRLVELLNECFGVLIVFTLIAAYIILSTQFYAFYKMSEGFDVQDIWLTIYTILWVILHGGKVVLILLPINDISDEQMKTGNYLFEIDLPSVKDSTNDETCFMIKKFADQLLHERTPPNALRIINLDLTLLSTIIGALTTYLVILIQFDASARAQTAILNATITN